MEPYLLSPTDRAEHRATSSTNSWRPLRLLNGYRLLIAALFNALYYTHHLFSPLGASAPRLFGAVSTIYLLACLVSVGLNVWQRPGFHLQVFFLVLVDTLAITLLMHSSGGGTSGLGMLLVVTIAGGSILTAGRTAMSFAALASLAVLAESLYAHYFSLPRTNSYPQAGLLGLTLFATAILAHVLARRIRETEALATQRGVDLANLAQLTEHIIQRMQTGIIVIDEAERIRLMNEAAWLMLGMPTIHDLPPLSRIAAPIKAQLDHWRTQADPMAQPVRLGADNVPLLPRFARIGSDTPGLLIYLEDTSATTQQAQQMKLASLGGLTASIAHEIRNPLGAISHAGQLLAESPALVGHDQRLVEIITTHSLRINAIIENVQQLSRRDQSRPTIFTLKAFLEHFLDELLATHSVAREDILIRVEPVELEVRFDPTQLHQILSNLCENALHHGIDDPGGHKVELLAHTTHTYRRPSLDVIDHGPGIDPHHLEHIFEPFYTTEPGGTGLGLYISRELAESNQAQLSYIPIPSGGSCFRLIFQDPRRQIP